jgi:predicted porin
MSGFQAGVGYSFATGNTGVYTAAAGGGASTGSAYNFATQNNMRQLTLGAKYANGPIYVAASYDKIYAQESKGQNASISSWNIAGTYDFKVVKLAAGYGQTRDGAVLGQGTGVTGAGNFNNIGAGNGEVIFAPAVGTNSYIVGATIPVNPVSRVLLSWTMLTPNTNMKDAYNAQNQTAYNIAYTYDFTKRTNMYGFFGYMNNYGTVDTAKSTIVGLGMRHQF